jgi:hypothetical protein
MSKNEIQMISESSVIITEMEEKTLSFHSVVCLKTGP